MDGWHARGVRALLQDARRAALLVAHARPLGGAARGKHRHLRRVHGAHGQDGHASGDGARYHWRRGGWRQQRGRQPRGPVHEAGGGVGGDQGAHEGAQRQVHDRGGLWQRARRVRAGQCQAHPQDLEKLAGVHLRAAWHAAGLDARLLCVPRRLGLGHQRHPRVDRLRRDQDEHRHGHAVVVLGRHQGVREGEPRLPAGPDWQPRGCRQAEQEVLRPAHADPRR